MSDLTLTADDCRRLLPLLTNAEAEVHDAVEPNATTFPDDPDALMASFLWSRNLRSRIQAALEEQP